jgi:cell division protein FtsQ
VVEAPAEDAFVESESPKPGPVRSKSRRVKRESAPAPGRGRTLSSLWSALKLASGVLVVVAASVAVAWGAHRYALSTPRFAVKKLDIRGSRRLGQQQIEKLAGIRVGENIFALDTAAAERRLLDDPWVKEVKITRQLPGTLRVELSEHEARAVASIDGSLYLLTRTGEPFKQLGAGDPFDLPVITGISAQNLARDRKGAIRRIEVGLDVLENYNRIPLSKTYPAEEVHLMAGGGAVLTVGKDGVTLELGHGPWRKKLLMAARVIGRLRAKGQQPGIVFLDNEAHPERVVVRMR